jgi:hypothetical protein
MKAFFQIWITCLKRYKSRIGVAITIPEGKGPAGITFRLCHLLTFQSASGKDNSAVVRSGFAACNMLF